LPLDTWLPFDTQLPFDTKLPFEADVKDKLPLDARLDPGLMNCRLPPTIGTHGYCLPHHVNPRYMRVE